MQTTLRCGNLDVRSRVKNICIWVDNTKTNFQEMELDVDRIVLAGDRGKGRGCLNTFMYFGSIKRGKLFDLGKEMLPSQK